MKIILEKNRHERIVDITDVEMFTADTKCIIATISGQEWFVKDKRVQYRASLKKMHEYSGDTFVFLDRDILVRRDQIVGRLNYDTASPIMAVLANGQRIEVARRRRAGFNKLIWEMSTNTAIDQK